MKDTPEYEIVKYQYLCLKGENNDELSLFGFATNLCELNYTNFEYWNTRHLLLKRFMCNFETISRKTKNEYMSIYKKNNCSDFHFTFFGYSLFIHDKNDFIKSELKWIKKILNINYKNYQIWNHIKQFSEYTSLKSSDFMFLEDYLMIDPRNVHFWTFISLHIKTTSEYEFGLNLTEKIIELDKTNNSAISLRFYLLKTYKSKEFEFLNKEIFLIRNMIYENKDIALINYLFGIASFYNIDDILLDFTLKNPKICIFAYKMVNYILAKNHKSKYQDCLKLVTQIKNFEDWKAYVIEKLKKK